MHALALLLPALLLAAVPAAAQDAPATRGADAQVSVTAKIVVLDREAFTRAGLAYLAVGGGRMHLDAAELRRLPRPFRARIGSGTLGIDAFLEAARESRWVRSEYTQQVLTLSGSEARISASTLAVGPYAARSRGPELIVTPTVLGDGRVRLRVSARVDDTVTDAWGNAVDGSPLASETQLVVRAGEPAVLASSATRESSRDAGLLRLRRADRQRDVLLVITPRVVGAP
ncbi:MAG TPA: hypothetical protein VF746_07455 [Longimicrobium sp.]|jgi:hypothetical protein